MGPKSLEVLRTTGLRNISTQYIVSIEVNECIFSSIFLQQHSQGCFVFFPTDTGVSGDFSIVDQVAGDEPDANPVLARGSSAGVGHLF